jgi:hypothetical protein
MVGHLEIRSKDLDFAIAVGNLTNTVRNKITVCDAGDFTILWSAVGSSLLDDAIQCYDKGRATLTVIPENGDTFVFR